MQTTITTTRKERPILFSAPMVQAILDGRKTATRRVIKTKNGNQVVKNGYRIELSDSGLVWQPVGGQPWEPFPQDRLGEYCPYGQAGDYLWVRETWANLGQCGDSVYIYKASDEKPHEAINWKPSIHMPRAASRILLEVTDVGVERIQDISAEDAIAEGIQKNSLGDWIDYPIGTSAAGWLNPIESFRSLWDSINSERGYSWDSNPWVWVVKFKRLQP